MAPTPGTPEWLNQVREDVVDPDQRIVDPHHHLWPEGGSLPYGLDELDADTGDVDQTGHRHDVVATVFVECHAAYRSDGPSHLRSVGETAFVAEAADRSATRPGPEIKGIVANADLTLEPSQLDEVLDAHAAAGGPRFKGIRHALARDPEPETLRIAGRAPEGLSVDDAFRAGVRRLGERGLTYDSWHYHHQNDQFADLAAACPDTTMILDHFGTPIGVGRFAGRLDEIFETWKDDIARIAEMPNVVAKLGGLAMPDNGYGWHERATPPSSDEVVDAQGRWYRHTIECFGPDRCMFESNFPVDRFSLSYQVAWNAMKKMTADFSAEDREAMFAGTAERIYSLT